MSIVEECPVESLKEREQYYLDTLTPYVDTIGYNLSPISGVTEDFLKAREARSAGRKRTPITEETRAKMRESKRGMKIAPEHLEKLLEGLRRKGRTEEHCRKISESNMGRIITPEMRQKISAKKKGVPISAEHKRKLDEGLVRKGRTKEHGMNISKGLRGKTSERRKISTKELAIKAKYSDREVLRGIDMILGGLSATKASKELGFYPGFFGDILRSSKPKTSYLPLLHAIGYVNSGSRSVTDLAKPEVRAKINTNIEFPEGSDNLLNSAEEHLAFLQNIGLTDGPDNQRK